MNKNIYEIQDNSKDKWLLRADSSELRQKSHINELSMVGKIIGKHFKKKMPYVPLGHKYMDGDFNLFKFDVPSPDDLRMAYLGKK